MKPLQSHHSYKQLTEQRDSTTQSQFRPIPNLQTDPPFPSSPRERCSPTYLPQQQAPPQRPAYFPSSSRDELPPQKQSPDLERFPALRTRRQLTCERSLRFLESSILSLSTPPTSTWTAAIRRELSPVVAQGVCCELSSMESARRGFYGGL